MYRTQLLLGLMLLGFMGTAAAVGTGDLDHPGGQTSISVNPRSFVTTIDTEYLLDMLPAPTVAAVSPDIPQIAGREAVAYKRDPGEAVLFGVTIKRATTQARTQAAHGLARWHHARHHA